MDSPAPIGRSIHYLSGKDLRNEPGYGIYPAKLVFCLRGEQGAVTLTVSTGWSPSSARNFEPMGHGVDIHRPAINAVDTDLHETVYCQFIGEACATDGSSLAGEELFQTLLDQGNGVMWAKLAWWYEQHIGELEASSGPG